MKKIVYRHGVIDGELADVIEANNITMICDDGMNIMISEEDYAKLQEVAPAVIDDFLEVEE